MERIAEEMSGTKEHQRMTDQLEEAKPRDIETQPDNKTITTTKTQRMHDRKYVRKDRCKTFAEYKD